VCRGTSSRLERCEGVCADSASTVPDIDARYCAPGHAWARSTEHSRPLDRTFPSSRRTLAPSRRTLAPARPEFAPSPPTGAGSPTRPNAVQQPATGIPAPVAGASAPTRADIPTHSRVHPRPLEPAFLTAGARSGQLSADACLYCLKDWSQSVQPLLGSMPRLEPVTSTGSPRWVTPKSQAASSVLMPTHPCDTLDEPWA
jgi:hypothetical protein